MLTVKFKPTGQLGTIPDNEYDPNIYEMAGSTPPVSSPAPQSPQVQSQQNYSAPSFDSVNNGMGSVLTGIGNSGINIAKSVFSAPARFGQGLGDAIDLTFNQGRIDEELIKKRQLNQSNIDMARRLQAEGKKKESFDLLTKNKQMVSDQQQKTSENVTYTDKKAEKGKEDTVKGAVGTASFFVPGGNSPVTRIVAGGVTGGMAGYGQSQKGNELTDTAGGAIIGAGTSAALEGLGWAKDALKKRKTNIPSDIPQENVLQKAGKYTKQKSAPIYTKGSVWGAEREDAINETLDRLGFKGTAQDKYAQLAPKFEVLNKSIKNELKIDPKTVKTSSIIDKFVHNLKSTLRRSELDSATAQKEIQDYLTDLAGGDQMPDKFKTDYLFELKKAVNEDYQSVIKKSYSNIPLNNREKVIAAARQTLDDIITETHPQVKDYTIMQSHLYDAAESLNRARKTVPTVRIAGTTVPTEVIQKAQDATGSLLIGAGDKVAQVQGGLGSITNKLPAVSMRSDGARNFAINQLVSASGGNVSNPTQNISQQPQGDYENYPANSQAQTELNTSTDHGTNLPSSPQDVNMGGGMGSEPAPILPKTLNPYGVTPEVIYREYNNALDAGDGKTAARLRTMYEDEVAYQKQNKTDTKTPKLSEGDKKFAFAGAEARKALTALDTIPELPVGPISGSGLMQKSRQLSGNQSNAESNFLSKVAIARTAARNALLGTNMSDKEIQSLLEFTFDASLPREVLRQRIDSFIDSMETYMETIAGPETTQSLGATPPNL